MKNEEMLNLWNDVDGAVIGISADDQIGVADSAGHTLYFSHTGERQLREYLVRRMLSNAPRLVPPRHVCKGGAACSAHRQNVKYRWAVFHRWPKEGSPVEMKIVHAATLVLAVDTFGRIAPGATVLAVNFLDADVKAGFGSTGPNVGQGTA